jgi:hypothetical protein
MNMGKTSEVPEIYVPGSLFPFLCVILWITFVLYFIRFIWNSMSHWPSECERDCASVWARQMYIQKYQESSMHRDRHTDELSEYYKHTKHSHPHTPALTIKLRCRRVWGLTLSRFSYQRPLCSKQPAHGSSIRRVLKSFFAQVACVLDRLRKRYKTNV